MTINRLFCIYLFWSLFCGELLHAKPIDFGHLLTGTTDTLEAGEVTIGTNIMGVGLTETSTLGVSPFAYLGYGFFNLVFRQGLKLGAQKFAVDALYFKTIDRADPENSFDQESIFLRFNHEFVLSDIFTLYSNFGLQYFIVDNSTFSLRSDPRGEYRSFRAKDDPFYRLKLESYRFYERDASTSSISGILKTKINQSFSINTEGGVLGVNYKIPLIHVGVSLNYLNEIFHIGIGLSKSIRTTPDLGREELTHNEIKLQYFF